MKLTVLSIAIRAIPEALAMIWIGIRLMGIKPGFKPILYAAVIQGIIGFIVRAFMPIKFGIHTLVILLFYIIVLYLFLHLDIGKAISVILLGAIVSGITEIITNPLIGLIGTPIDVLQNSTALQLLYGLPSLALMFIIGWLGGILVDNIKKQRIVQTNNTTVKNEYEHQ